MFELQCNTKLMVLEHTTIIAPHVDQLASQHLYF
jgi:hypothetical protein